MFGGVPTLFESDNGQIPRALGIVIQESRQCNGHSVPANTQYYHVQQISFESRCILITYLSINCHSICLKLFMIPASRISFDKFVKQYNFNIILEIK